MLLLEGQCSNMHMFLAVGWFFARFADGLPWHSLEIAIKQDDLLTHSNIVCFFVMSYARSLNLNDNVINK